jgi:hypothetical protein
MKNARRTLAAVKLSARALAMSFKLGWQGGRLSARIDALRSAARRRPTPAVTNGSVARTLGPPTLTLAAGAGATYLLIRRNGHRQQLAQEPANSLLGAPGSPAAP